MNTTNAPMNATKTAFTAPSAPLSHLPAKLTGLPLLAALAVTTVFLGAGSAHADEIRPGLICDYFYGMTTCANTTDTGYTVTESRDCTWAYKSDGPKTMKVSTFFVPPQFNGLVSSSGCGSRSDSNSAKSVTYSIVPPPAP